MSALAALRARGMLARSSAGLEAAVAGALGGGARLAAYAGFDPTAGSLHVGHLASLLPLVHLSRAGLVPIALVRWVCALCVCGAMARCDGGVCVGGARGWRRRRRGGDGCGRGRGQVGGATALIGDPSGRSEERPLLAAESVAANAAGIVACLSAVLRHAGVEGATVLSNAPFYEGMHAVAFLRDVGRCAPCVPCTCGLCVCVCVRVRTCVRVRACVGGWGVGGSGQPIVPGRPVQAVPRGEHAGEGVCAAAH